MPEWLAWILAIAAIVAIPWVSGRILHHGWATWFAIGAGILVARYVIDAIQKPARPKDDSN
jgi:hypothetical protein